MAKDRGRTAGDGSDNSDLLADDLGADEAVVAAEPARKAGSAKAGSTKAGSGGTAGALPADVQSKLDAAEQRIRDLESRLAEEVHGGRGLRVRAGGKPFAGPTGGYLFEVYPLQPAKFPHLQPAKVHAVDESEAKRWYAESNEEPPGSNKQLDLVRVKIEVKCLDRRRNALIMHKQTLSGIRARIASGASLTDREVALLEKHEDEIMNFPKEIDVE